MTREHEIRFETHAERFFVRVGDAPVYTPNGLSATPSKWRTVPQKRWSEWESVSCLALLGDPSAGKTTEFEFQLQRSREQGRVAFITYWKEWFDGEELTNLVDDAAEFRRALEGGEEVTWFVDSLDEGRVKVEAAFGHLLKTLKRLKDAGQLRNLRLRLSCRAADWRKSEESALRQLFASASTDEISIEAIQLLPLDEISVRTLAHEKLNSQASVDSFVVACDRRYVLGLTGHPLVLGLMLADFKASGSLGENRTAIYSRAVSRLASESNEVRIEAGSTDTKLSVRIEVAAELATRLVLGGHDGIAFPDIVEGPNILDAEGVVHSRAEIKATLNTGLFSKLANGSFTFFHRSFAEYLAARSLADGLDSGWRIRAILPLFPVAAGGVPSPLRETAAWLAGLNGRFQNWLVESDPSTACLGDTILYSPANRLALIRSLAIRYKDRAWQTEFSRMGDLGHAIAEAELRELLSRSNGQAVRIMAVNMLESAGQSAHLPVLEELALDCTEDPQIRARAVMVLGSAAPARYAAALAPLLILDADQDPTDEIAGAVLQQLFPHHLSTAQALTALRTPREPNTLGLFRYFWNDVFGQRLPDDQSNRRLTLMAFSHFIAHTFGEVSADHSQLSGFDHHRQAITQRHLVEMFARLLMSEIKDPQHEIECTGVWLKQLVDWALRFGSLELTSSLVDLLISAPELKRELIEWILPLHQKDVRLDLSRVVPLHGLTRCEADGPLYVELVRRHITDPNVAVPLYQELIWLSFQFPSDAMVEAIEELASRADFLMTLWECSRVCATDSPMAASRHIVEQGEASRRTAELEVIRSVIDHIEDLRRGDSEALAYVLFRAGVDNSGPPSLDLVNKYFGADVEAAVADGLVQAWRSFTRVDQLWLPKTSDHSIPLSNMAIAASRGFHLYVGHDDDLTKLTDAQIECVLWLALHWESDWINPLNRAWRGSPSIVWARFEYLLDAESAQHEHAPALLWGRLVAAKELPGGLVERLVAYAVANFLHGNSSVRAYMFGFVWRHAARPSLVAEMLPALRARAEVMWTSPDQVKSDAEYSELVVLAMWWLLDPTEAVQTLGNKVFIGPRQQARSLGFVTAIQRIQSPELSVVGAWNLSISFEAYAELLPLLFGDAGGIAQEPFTNTDASLQLAMDARNRLVTLVASAPPIQAERWFASWRSDPRFGVYRDWLARIHGDLLRQLADATWRPLTNKEADAVLMQKGALVRTADDVVLFLDDVIECDLAPSFRKDYSLTPLLWGKKGKGARKHLDEKELQTAVYALLRVIVGKTPLVGAREPEQFDAKKPDFRLSFLLGGGLPIDVPIEIKWSDNPSVWNALADQLLGKYMLDPSVRHGVYIVAWADASTVIKGHFGKPTTPGELLVQLQSVAKTVTNGTGKTIAVHVIDASVAQ